MTFDAVRPEPGHPVRRRSRRIVLRPMTRHTIARHIHVFKLLLVDMALLAWRRHVRPKKREAGLGMPLTHVGNQPRFRRMASFALRSQLATVNVHVATRTLRRSLGKHQILMTLIAWDIRVLIA